MLLDLLIRIWAMRRRAVITAVAATVLAVLLTYRLSVSPPSLQPRVFRIGVAQTQVLVGSSQSPLANAVGSPTSVSTLAETVAELAGSSTVTDAIARSVRATPDQIGVDEQLPLNVPLAVSDARGPQVGAQILSAHQPYHLLVRNDQGSSVVQIFTQASSARAAIRMANAAAQSLVGYAKPLAKGTNIPLSRQVVIQQLAPASGGVVDPNASRDAAILLAIIFWFLGMTALLTLQRKASRRAGTTRTGGVRSSGRPAGEAA